MKIYFLLFNIFFSFFKMAFAGDNQSVNTVKEFANMITGITKPQGITAVVTINKIRGSISSKEYDTNYENYHFSAMTENFLQSVKSIMNHSSNFPDFFSAINKFFAKIAKEEAIKKLPKEEKGIIKYNEIIKYKDTSEGHCSFPDEVLESHIRFCLSRQRSRPFYSLLEYNCIEFIYVSQFFDENKNKENYTDLFTMLKSKIMSLNIEI